MMIAAVPRMESSQRRGASLGLIQPPSLIDNETERPTRNTAAKRRPAQQQPFLLSFSAESSVDTEDDYILFPASSYNTADVVCGAYPCFEETVLPMFWEPKKKTGRPLYAGLELEEPETCSISSATAAPEALIRSPPSVGAPVPSFEESSLDGSPHVVPDDAPDPIERARKRANRVRFAVETQVTSFEAVPKAESAALFWSEMEGYELRNERRRVLQNFKWHLSYAGSLVPWSEDQDSIRGLEDHYADYVGQTNSYYIRQRHQDLVLREFRRTQWKDAEAAAERLGEISLMSSECNRQRAAELANLDHIIAQDEDGSKTAAAYSPALLCQGEDFVYALLARLRDYT